MRRSTLVFALFVILIAGIIGYNTFLKQQPPIEVVIAVDPMIEEWAKSLADKFNAKDVLVNNGTTKVRIRIDASKNDVTVWQGKANWTTDNHPSAWFATSGASLAYAPSNLPFRVVAPSLARTPLVWGGFTSRVALITQSNAQVLDWQAVQQACSAQRWANIGGQTNWGNINMGVDWATSSMGGYGALLSLSAHYQNSDQVDRIALTQDDFLAWFTPIEDAIQNSERLGESSASAMASRGASVADFALLPEVDWLRNLNNLNNQETMVFAYPAHNVVLDFPLALWDDTQTTTIEREAVQAFADYVLSAEGQQSARDFGLRPVTGEPTDTDALFVTAVPLGIVLEPNYGAIVTAPDRNTADQLLRLLD